MKLTAAFLCTAVLFGGAQALICSAFFELHVDTAISDDHIDDYISGIGDAKCVYAVGHDADLDFDSCDHSFTRCKNWRGIYLAHVKDNCGCPKGGKKGGPGWHYSWDDGY